MKLGQYNKAEEEFNSALKLFEQKDESGVGKYRVQFNKAINYRNMGKLSDSIDWFSKVIDDPAYKDKKISPSSAYNLRGLSNFELGQFSEAAKDFKSAIETTSEEIVPSYYNNRGLANYHQKFYEEALADFDTAIEMEIDNR